MIPLTQGEIRSHAEYLKTMYDRDMITLMDIIAKYQITDILTDISLGLVTTHTCSVTSRFLLKNEITSSDTTVFRYMYRPLTRHDLGTELGNNVITTKETFE